ncbi:bet domain protein, partial [Escherichia coli 95.0183]
MTPDIILQRTG